MFPLLTKVSVPMTRPTSFFTVYFKGSVTNRWAAVCEIGNDHFIANMQGVQESVKLKKFLKTLNTG